MSDQFGFDIDIPDNDEQEIFTIIYKGKTKEDGNEEKVEEIQISKKLLLSKLRYFKKQFLDIEQKNELFIHDKFCIDNFKIIINTLHSKKVHLTANNYQELYDISHKYEYYEIEHKIKQFIEQRPDLHHIIQELTNKDRTEEEEQKDDYDENDIEKEEIIAKNLDRCLDIGIMKNINTKSLVRILKSPKKVLSDHHKLFDFINDLISTRTLNYSNESDLIDKEDIEMLIGTLDYAKMNKEQISSIVNNKFYSTVFAPQHCKEMQQTIIDENRQLTEKLQQIANQIEQLEMQHQIQLNKIEEEQKSYEQECKALHSRIEALEKENAHFKSEQERQINIKLVEHEEKIKQIEEKHSLNIDTINGKIDMITNKVDTIEKENIKCIEINGNKEQKQEEKYQAIIKNIELLKENINNINPKIENISQIESINNAVHKQADRMINLETEIIAMKSKAISLFGHSVCQSFSTKLSLTEPGILCELKKKEKTPFDRLFIASQSTNDLYNLIDPNTKDHFSTNSDGDFFIEFELEEATVINAILFFSYTQDFPKSFDIEIDGNKIISIKEAQKLNSENQEMKVCFDSIRGKKICFIQTGSNWDKKNNFLFIKKIELLSPEAKYSKGVFSTLVANSENQDPHKCPVIISAKSYDLNSFQSLDSKMFISTFDNKNEWLQVELTQGLVILNGFRLKRSSKKKIRSYKIICTDDANKSQEFWTKLIEIDEQRKDEHKDLDIYEFMHPSPPVRFIRFIQTGPKWNNELFLQFYHFDLFGSYI